MANFSNPLEIYKILPKTNCKLCQLLSCLAFSVAVLKGDKRLSDCPALAPELSGPAQERPAKKVSLEERREPLVAQLQHEVAALDLAARAANLGGEWQSERLVLPCLGKNFFIDRYGTITSECHINVWLTIPMLQYVVTGAPKSLAGSWVTFRELASGPTWYPLFRQKCELPLLRLAETHPELFADLITLFKATRAASHFAADIAVVLHPLPKLPLLICYWRADEGLEAKLTIYFEATAEENLPIDAIHTLGVGFAAMLEKIMRKHSG